jgi:hypothetical protein
MQDAIWMLVVLAVIVVVVLIGYVPGSIAKRRGHPSWEAIRICGLIGLLIWPCWIIALIWAYTGRPNPPPAKGNTAGAGEPDYHLGTPRPRCEIPSSTEEVRALEVKSRRERAAEKERGNR